MRRFQFPLEGVTRVRELAVREKKIELAHAQQALRQAEEEQRRTCETIRLSLQGAPRGTVVQVQHLLDSDSRMRRLRAELGRGEAKRRDNERTVEQRRSSCSRRAPTRRRSSGCGSDAMRSSCARSCARSRSRPMRWPPAPCGPRGRHDPRSCLRSRLQGSARAGGSQPDRLDRGDGAGGRARHGGG